MVKKENTKECCATCRRCLSLEIWDCKKSNVPKVEMPGYVCAVYAPEGMCIYMVGLDPETERCECYSERKVN